MRRRLSLISCILCFALFLALPGCNSEGAPDASATSPDGQETEGEADKPKDAYEEYIRNVIDSVDGNNETEAGNNAPAEDPGRDIRVDRTAPSDFYVSSMEQEEDPEFQFPNAESDPLSSSTAEESPSPTKDPKATPTPEPTPYITPDEFEVDTCCIYINGESDSAYGTEIVTAINKTREDLGYKTFAKNKGLSDCADRRTREIAANFSHTRPNGQPFYSVAPEHFKAEIIIKNNQKAEEAVDTLIKNDPLSRDLIFSKKYQSVGASSFKCNGLKYTVVSFGL